MKQFGRFLFSLGLVTVSSTYASTSANARVLCTVIADASKPNGAVVLQQGDCATRVTPASTFKLPLAIMGYDSGFLVDAEHPKLPFKKGYADWGGEEWRRPTDPARWMQYSVVWYSQQIARELGMARLTKYAGSFGYGNADFSGDPGKNNGLERSWISSSLKISPLEQVAFLQRFVGRDLPVASATYDKTISIVEHFDAGNGWMIVGKTGSAFPRKPDGNFDRAAGWGWYVGWATKGDKRYVFARLARDEKRETKSGGLRARDAFIEEWPTLVKTLR